MIVSFPIVGKSSASSDPSLQKRQTAFKVQPPHPVTPDGRYFVARGKLWRMADPNLSSAKEAAAHRAVDFIKRELGERGPVWWTDGTPDLNRHVVKNTPYAKWYSGLRASRRRGECV